MPKIIGNTTATPNPRPDWAQTDETKADYIKNKPIGKDNITKAYGYKINDVILLSSEEVTEYGITPTENVNYGFYTLNVEAPSSLVGKEYSVQIAQSFYCVGKILAVNGNDVIVENIPVDENGAVIGLDKNNDNEATGNIRNVLILTDHPELGDTLIGYFSNSNGLMNKNFSRNTLTSGQENNAIGQSSAAFGWKNKTGYMAFAAGAENKALGQYSFIAGGHKNTVANGAQSGYAEGNGNTIKANHGHAEGNLNTVHPGAQSGHVEGDGNGVFGYASHAGGTSAFAYGKYSFAHGIGVSAYGRDSAVFGKYNDPGSWNDDENNVGTYAFTVGNGKNNDNRSNALTLDWDGNLEIAGDIVSNGKKLENYDDTGIKTELKNYTDDKVANLVNSAPETLNTLKELADALNNDKNFAATILNELDGIKKYVDEQIGLALEGEY